MRVIQPQLQLMLCVFYSIDCAKLHAGRTTAQSGHVAADIRHESPARRRRGHRAQINPELDLDILTSIAPRVPFHVVRLQQGLGAPSSALLHFSIQVHVCLVEEASGMFALFFSRTRACVQRSAHHAVSRQLHLVGR